MSNYWYRGYTMAQLDEIIDFAKQQMFEPGEKRQMIRSYTPMQFIPPALFSPEQLEQIRVVVQKELQAAIMKPSVFDTSAMTSEELTEHLKDWKPTIQHPYIAGNPSSQWDLGAFQIKEQATGDISTDEQEAFLKGQRKAV